MAANSKNLRYCEVLYNSTHYDVMIAVDDLDEVNNILQDWALDTLGATLNLPEALIQNKDITEVLTSKDIDNFVYLQSANSSYIDMPRSAGIKGDFPTLPTVLVGGLYVAPATNAYLYSESDFDGYFGEYSIDQKSFSLSSGVNFLGIRFNSGSPEYILYTDDTSFNYSDIIPVATILYFSSTIYNIPYGQSGYGLAEKLLKILKERDEFVITSDFTLGTSTNHVELGALTVNRGTQYISCGAFDSEEANNDMYLFYKDAMGTWQTSSSGVINNTQYQSNSGLASLGAGEFVINYIYRVVHSGELLVFIKLSSNFASLASAKESDVITDLPDTIKNSCVLVGRIIVEQGSSSPIVQKIQKYSFGVV